MSKVIDIRTRRQPVTGKDEEKASKDDLPQLSTSISEDFPGLVFALVSLVNNPLEISALVEKVDLIKKLERTYNMTNQRKAAALEAVSRWSSERIIEELIKTGVRQIQTTPALYIVALDKLLGELTQL